MSGPLRGSVFRGWLIERFNAAAPNTSGYLMGGDPRGSGGTGKAEAGKCAVCIPATGLPGVGILPKQRSSKYAAEKEKRTASVACVEATPVAVAGGRAICQFPYGPSSVHRNACGSDR